MRVMLSMLIALAWGAPVQEWPRVMPGLELRYPRDHGAHPQYQTEWWYLTGHLAADDGRRFGFQFTVFRRATSPGDAPEGSSPLRARQVFAGHFALTDLGSGKTSFAERLRRNQAGLAGATQEDLRIELEDWSLGRGADDSLALVASDVAAGMALELELVPRKPLVLHGDRGVSAKGQAPGNASAYMSWTRLEARGTVKLAGQSLAVQGSAWFDHEFGSSVLEEGAVGWDWFGLQLDDGRELMLFWLRGQGGQVVHFGGTLVDQAGSARSLTAGDVLVESQSTWTSPRTKAKYPSSWSIRIPSTGLELVLRPLAADCEIESAASTGTVYWEGPVEVLGQVRGRGYAELTGYAGSMGGRL